MPDYSATHNPKTILTVSEDLDSVLFHPRFLSKEWVEYPGSYVKTFYDVELKDGTFLTTVYPIEDKWDGHDSSEVRRVRFAVKNPLTTLSEDEETEEL